MKNAGISCQQREAVSTFSKDVCVARAAYREDGDVDDTEIADAAYLEVVVEDSSGIWRDTVSKARDYGKVVTYRNRGPSLPCNRHGVPKRSYGSIARSAHPSVHSVQATSPPRHGC